MCINDLIEECESLKNVVEVTKELDGKEICYFYQDLKRGESDYAKYFIIDLHVKRDENIINHFFSDINKFEILQESLLSETFFNVNDDMRFNLYFVILINEICKITIRNQILCNYNYCRKLIFDDNDAKLYFNSLDVLSRTNNESFVEKLSTSSTFMTERIISFYKQADFIENNLFYKQQNHFTSRKFHLLTFLLPSKRKHSKMVNTYDMFMKKLMMNNFESQIIKYVDELYHGTKFNKHVIESKAKYTLQRVSSLSIYNYKNFTNVYNIRFSRVNLLIGENGSGKTSIIKTIRNALTGSNLPSDELSLKCINNENRVIEFNNKSTNYDIFSNAWYNVTKRFLDDYFGKFNYFDGGKALEFALNDVDMAELFINNSFIRSFKAIEDLKNELTDRYTTAVTTMEIEKKKRNWPDINTALKILENNKVAFTNEDGFIRINLTKNDSDYNKKTRLAIKTIHYENIKLVVKNAKSESDPHFDFSKLLNEVMDNLGIHEKIEHLFALITASRDYENVNFYSEKGVAASKVSSKISVPISEMSAGQRVCYAFAAFLAAFLQNSNAPNIILLDEPAANLDMSHLLNILDILRNLALNGTQIFFTSADLRVAKLFRRKFNFFGDDFVEYRLYDSGNGIIYEKYN